MASYIGAKRETYNYLALARKLLLEAEKKAEDIGQAGRQRAAERIRRARKRLKVNCLKRSTQILSEERAKSEIAIKKKYLQMLHDAKREMLNISIALSQRILEREVSLSSESIARELEGILKALVSEHEHTLVVHPADRLEIEVFLAGASGLPSFSIREDDLLSPGNARVETETGIIELDWRSKLRSIVDLAREPLMSSIL